MHICRSTHDKFSRKTKIFSNCEWENGLKIALATGA